MSRRRAVVRKSPRLMRHTMSVVGVLIVVTALSVVGWMHREALPQLPEEGIAPIHRVVVEGPFERVSTTEVEGAVLPHLTGNFFTVDLAAIRRAAESLDWVMHAQVMREWPDSVHIVVTEQRAAWLWGEDALLNEVGERFVRGLAERPEDLPRLDGPIGSELQLVDLYIRAERVLSNCAMGVARLEVDDRRAVRITLDGGLLLHLGREGTTERIDRFCEVVVVALAPRFREVAYVDMRYTNGFAVGWRNATAYGSEGGRG